ncbi:hypothetical protein N7494_010967 [Penicillium frequentans]|uniref:Uncharacterized protein n=1 Tax=Penicillium frequentans TaxID=3151616 RepID=A0AAD6G9P3_9EURO|nr:hypothetical protein N7494_010967 [Penicillium glabrum]
MSTTTTQTRASVPILADYELHHSGSQVNEPPASLSHISWPVHYRRIPPHRPINYDLDFDERPTGSNPVESVFVSLTLHGAWLNGSIARLWRKTGGRINDRVFRYEVGGEW